MSFEALVILLLVVPYLKVLLIERWSLLG